MSKSQNTNPNIYRSKWDLPHGNDDDYKRKDRRRIIEEELELYEDEEKDDTLTDVEKE